MTGGIGFSRDAKKSLQKNRDILSSRKNNTQNPYWGYNQLKRNVVNNFYEILRWKEDKNYLHKKRSFLIFAMLRLVVIAVLLYFVLYEFEVKSLFLPIIY